MADVLASGLDSETVLSRRALNHLLERGFPRACSAPPRGRIRTHPPGPPVTDSGRQYQHSTPGAP